MFYKLFVVPAPSYQQPYPTPHPAQPPPGAAPYPTGPNPATQFPQQPPYQLPGQVAAAVVASEPDPDKGTYTGDSVGVLTDVLLSQRDKKKQLRESHSLLR